ncbi:transporter [Lysobacter panacisoli]|uniref:Transporter n=1 Tax=Lysobacter panacisoli TaxID=1255263 RepID=A0ABP9LRS6_9GAMM|nr:transporter [Lysobacter panacisoli]
MNPSVKQARAGLTLVALIGLAITTGPASAQDSADELAKKLSNPVASLISIPLQYNADFGYGSEDGTRHTLNIQPVIPASISEDWNLISRIIVPVIYQDDIAGKSGSQFGLGDINPTFFFSPKQPTKGGITWGVGPVFLLPTASDDLLGPDQWGAGPSVLVLTETHGWTIGVLANHIWSVAGSSNDPDISNTFLQPFFAKHLPGGRTLTFNAESTYDWENQQWTVPINVTYSKVTRVGSQMMSFAGGVRGYADAPTGGPDWGLRFVVTFLVPPK